MRINKVDLHIADSGDGPEVIVFSHGMLISGVMFDPQVAALSRRYRCVVYDHRGQGRSAVPKSGYDMDTLTEDAINLIETLKIGPCHFVGVSLGAAVGLRLALRRPDLLRSLILISGNADPEPGKSRARYWRLNFLARLFGLKLAVGRVMPIVFGQTFLNDPKRAKERNFWRRQIAAGDRYGVTRTVTGIIERDGLYAELGGIKTPTLVLAGDEDVAAPPAGAERMHRAIPGSRFKRIAKAGHCSTLEQPDAVNVAIKEFLATIDS
jgi:3-oxoadipate enol-lactonase